MALKLLQALLSFSMVSLCVSTLAIKTKTAVPSNTEPLLYECKLDESLRMRLYATSAGQSVLLFDQVKCFIIDATMIQLVTPRNYSWTPPHSVYITFPEYTHLYFNDNSLALFDNDIGFSFSCQRCLVSHRPGALSRLWKGIGKKQGVMERIKDFAARVEQFVNSFLLKPMVDPAEPKDIAELEAMSDAELTAFVGQFISPLETLKLHFKFKFEAIKWVFRSENRKTRIEEYLRSYMTYTPRDLILNIMFYLFGSLGFSGIPSAVEGYNTNPGADLRDTVRGISLVLRVIVPELLGITN